MQFIHDDFLLKSETAWKLYHAYATSEPILDYHSRLPPADIAQDRHFHHLSEIWLLKKFLAWAQTVPFTLRNPLYHWTHLELKRYFGIDELLNENNAKRIWELSNAPANERSISSGDYQKVSGSGDLRE
jgi:glucuronate isomerase